MSATFRVAFINSLVIFEFVRFASPPRPGTIRAATFLFLKNALKTTEQSSFFPILKLFIVDLSSF